MVHPIQLRPFSLGDKDIIYVWQSTPGIRRYARNPGVPTPAEHTAWFEKALAGDMNFIILCAQQRAGMIRLAPPLIKAPVLGLEVSLLVAPEYQGHGVAAKALRMIIADYAGDARVLAEVHPDNQASRRLFQSCGFSKLVGDWYVSPEKGSNVKRKNKVPE